jgi:3-oxoacyl-[acyl-carrier-protein] synthase II
MLAAARRGGFEDMYPLLQFTSIADVIADEFGTCGQPISLCTACASGSSAIQMGAEAIRRGETSASLCIATDATVHPEGIIRFSLLSALSTRNEPPEAASRPFAADRDGFVIAEGAGAMVLENYDAALARGADVLAIVMGAGERADEFHRTRSRPDGTAMIGAIEGALKDANVSPEEIDYINAHGTATPENDKMECLSLTAVFGKNVVKTPISSNKSMTGHTLIAAGAVEAVFSVMTIQSGIIPPTINYNKPDPTIALDVVPNISRNKPVSKVLSNSFGFGGQNCCLVFGLQ